MYFDSCDDDFAMPLFELNGHCTLLHTLYENIWKICLANDT